MCEVLYTENVSYPQVYPQKYITDNIMILFWWREMEESGG